MTSLRAKLQEKMKPEYFFWAALLLAVLLVGTDGPIASLPAETLAAAAAAPAGPDPFEELEIEAKAAVVYDGTSGTILFAKNATTSLPLASITKVMTAVVALRALPETTILPIELEAIKQEGDSGLRVGERWLLRDLIKFMLLESSNDAAYAISSNTGAVLKGVEDRTAGREFFIGKMNDTARNIGLSVASFQSESGLDRSDTLPSASASAEDTAKLMAYATQHFPGIFSETKWSKLALENGEGESRQAQNTNKSTDKLPLLIASKTGYTDLAGGNLVIAFDAGFNHPVIIVVLGSTAAGRFTDVEKLVWATLEYLAQAR